MSYVLRGTGDRDLAPGPEYPRITENPDGTRRIEWWPGQVSTSVEVQDLPSQEGGDRPRYYPGYRAGARWWYPTPGQARIYPATRELTPTDVIVLPRRLRPDVLAFAVSYVGGATEEEAQESLGPDRTLPCFSDEFRFVYVPSNVPGQLFETAQAPTHGWPDQVPTYPDGAPNPYRTYAGRGGYATGTREHPYRPWLDPANALYGHCVGHVADRAMPPAPPGPREPPPAPAEPQLPETHDPWEDVPPVVDGPWAPDPEDPDGPLIPTDPDPDDPADPDPVPCWDGRTGRTGYIDPVTGECVPDDAGGPVDPGSYPDPADPTGDPSGPPRGGVSNATMGLGVLLVMFLASRRR